jgi:hypothetical protein
MRRSASNPAVKINNLSFSRGESSIKLSPDLSLN